jgi:indoleamine 2,3-dioxygenase
MPEPSPFPRGFLPARDPVVALPERFAAWNAAATDLPRLLVSERVRDHIDALPPFETRALSTEGEFERAMTLLSFLAHAYVQCGEMTDHLPARLAQPWVEVARRLGRPPILSYASYNLNNWRPLNGAQPAWHEITLDNIAIVQHFLGGKDEQWFQMVHIAIEAQATPGIAALAPMQQAALDGDDDALIARLAELSAAIAAMQRTLERIPEKCDPYIYYHRVRPYMFGWKDNPGLPNGMLYEGVAEFNNQPAQMRGETGAQTATIYAFDGALGIRHEVDAFRSYLLEMREYMPPAHRAFIAQLEAGPSVREHVMARRAERPGLRKAYNDCVQRLMDFRATHLGYAASYIAKHAQREAGNSTELGTGGTPFMRYLAQHRAATNAHLV